MNINSRTTLSEAIGGTALFALWGLALIAGEFPHEWGIPLWIQGVFSISLIFILPVGMCIGWIRGFPRWSYPYAGHVLIFSWYMTRVATPGFLFDRELWGWRAWIPLIVIAVIALAVTRSIRPMLKFFTNIWNDWTLLTFSMFGFMPLLVAIGFDEMDRPFSLYFMIILTIVMAGAAWFYMRADIHWHRVIALLVGILLTTGITVIAPTIFWLKNGWVDPAGMALMGGIVVLIMFSPVLIWLIHQTVNLRKERHVMD